MLFTKVKDFIAKYWFLGTTVVIGVLYFLYDRQARRLGEVIRDVQAAKLDKVLGEAKSDVAEKEEAFKKDYSAYAALRAKYKPPVDGGNSPST